MSLAVIAIGGVLVIVMVALWGAWGFFSKANNRPSVNKTHLEDVSKSSAASV